MRRLVAPALAAIVVALLPSPAHAARVSKFRVTDAGSTIVWGLTVCAKRGLTVFLRPRLTAEERGPYFRGTAVRTQPRRCTRWQIEWPDEYGEGPHSGRIKVRIPATGFVDFTRTRFLWIS